MNDHTIIKAEAAQVPEGRWASTLGYPHSRWSASHTHTDQHTLQSGKCHISKKPDAKDPAPPLLPTGNTQADRAEAGAGKCYQWTWEFRSACSRECSRTKWGW